MDEAPRWLERGAFWFLGVRSEGCLSRRMLSIACTRAGTGRERPLKGRLAQVWRFVPDKRLSDDDRANFLRLGRPAMANAQRLALLRCLKILLPPFVVARSHARSPSALSPPRPHG